MTMAMTDWEYQDPKATALSTYRSQDQPRPRRGGPHPTRQSEPDSLERTDRMSTVLGSLLGIASAEGILRHHDNKDAAARTIEAALAKALDKAQDNDDYAPPMGAPSPRHVSDLPQRPGKSLPAGITQGFRAWQLTAEGALSPEFGSPESR